MTQFATVSDLRGSLAALLNTELGTFENGIKRIWVRPPDPPAGVAEGLECIIQRIPAGPIRGSSGGQKKDLRRWVVTLTNYAEDGAMAAATDKIKATYTLATAPRYVPPTDKNYESISFQIFDPTLINP